MNPFPFDIFQGYFVKEVRFTVGLNPETTALARHSPDRDDGTLNDNYYTKPLNFLNDYPQGHNSNGGLATHKLGVLGCRVKLLQVLDTNDHIVDIANSPLP
jgi:hypothetical protein